MNSFSAIGRLGRDPSTKEVNGTNVCAFSLAVDSHRGTFWLEVRVWGRVGENCQKYLKKGREVFVIGSFEVREWQGRDGEKRSELRVNADRVKFLGGGNEQKAATAPASKAPIDDAEIPF
jgi:single-strand DNA-binding protein